MDPHSEVEAKFEAQRLQVSQIQEWVDSEIHTLFEPRYEHVTGVDTFMKIGDDKTVRVRGDYSFTHGRKSTCVTVKQRKSKDSMLDRKEVDLFVDPRTTAGDAEALFAMLGGKVEFRLRKTYHVWMIDDGKYVVCLALYDVEPLHATGAELKGLPERFLEVEIERHSSCTEAEGKAELDRWIGLLRKQFSLEAPVNYSLYEKFKP